jgi:hypothetical protein
VFIVQIEHMQRTALLDADAGAPTFSQKGIDENTASSWRRKIFSIPCLPIVDQEKINSLEVGNIEMFQGLQENVNLLSLMSLIM